MPTRVTSSSPPGLGTDEFPHLDIINDLFDEDRSVPRSDAMVGRYDHPHHYHHPNFNRQYSFPGNADMGSFSNSTGLYDPSEQHYDDGIFQRVYGSSSAGPLHRQYPQMDLSMYAGGQIDGMAQNQWPYGSAADLRMLNLGNADIGGYPLELPDYPYSNCANGYAYHRPGHGL